MAVLIITGGQDEEMARDGDVATIRSTRYARTDEYLTVLKQQLHAAQPFDHDGRFYQVRQGFSAIKPSGLPIFFGGTSLEAPVVAISAT